MPYELDNLKPCPFCGGTAYKGRAAQEYCDEGYFIACESCGAQTEYDGDHESAAVLWNRRVEKVDV